MMHKKGSPTDLAFIIVFIFMFAVGSILGVYVFRSINASSPFSSSTEAQNIMDNWDDKSILFDRMALFLMVGMAIAGILASFLTRTHPAFLFIGILIWIIMMILSVVFSNAYEEISTPLASETSDFVVSSFIMNNLPLFILIYGALLLIIFYSANRDIG